MRVLIAGATGFIGRGLVCALASLGHEPIALSRDPRRAQRMLPELAAVHRWSAGEELPPAGAFDGVDALVNLVGQRIAGRWTSARKREIYGSRVVSTRNLVDAMEGLAERPSVLVSASAAGYYRDGGDAELTESDPANDDFLGNLCVHWEAAAERAEQLGVRVVRIRSAWVVSRGGGFLAAMLPLFNLGLGGPMGSGRQWWPWVHRDDAVGLILYTIAHDELSGPVNVTSPSPARQRDFAETLGRVLRRPAVLPVPAFALRLILGEFATEVLSSRRAVPRTALDAGYAFKHVELEPALRAALARP